MAQPVDPKLFGLHPSTRLERSGNNKFSILIDRKSRIIMKDGKKILEKITKIKSHVRDAEVDIRTTAPVCSKTKEFLKEHGVSLHNI
jgi:hypothetical protein